jgi:hypothetical protein
MSLSFLFPAFLIGLAALAVPIIIHLTRRQSKQSIDFPSLMFVQQIPHRSTQRRSIRNWPLFLMRCAAVALITLAFARPLFDREETAAAAATTGAREVVVLLDRSHSMGMGGRWERAKSAALEQLDGLSQADRATLVLFDSGADPVVESTHDRGRLRAAVTSAEVSARSTRYAPAFRYAERVLATSAHPRREIVMISDFQRHGWDADQGEAASIRLPVGTLITPVEIAGDATPNVVIAAVSFRRTLAAGVERAVTTVRIANQGPEAFSALPVTLELDGRPVETRTVRLDPDGTATAEFAPVTLPARGVVRGVVRLAGDALPGNNVHHFALSPDQRVRVVLVDGGGRAAYFLERVLAIGDAPGFRTVIRPAGGLRAADIADADVVVLNQTPLPGGEVGARLRTFVENGGGVVMLMGDHRTGGWDGAFPDRTGRAVDHSGTGGVALGFIDFGHPTFEPFSTPRSGDFTAPRFFRYRAVPETPEDRVLARFSDGGAALTERRVERGRVLVWGSTMDDGWNDLAIQPVFLPFAHQIVKYASGYAPPQPSFTVGDPFDPAGVSAAAERFTMALTPSGERLEIGERGPLTLDEAGFYELRHPRSGELALSIAVNVDPAESELTRVAPEELVNAFTASSQSGGAPAPVALTVQERERQQGAWWYLVVVGFVLLAAETVLSNWRRKPRPIG